MLWYDHSSSAINFLWRRKTVFVRNKPIIKTFLASNHCIQLKYKSINNIAFFGEKFISSESGEKYAQIKHLLRTLIWTKSNGLKLKIPWWCICFLQTNSFSLHKMLTDGLEWCGLLWCFYQLFGLSFWRHPFTAEDPLPSKWCNAKFLQIRSNK